MMTHNLLVILLSTLLITACSEQRSIISKKNNATTASAAIQSTQEVIQVDTPLLAKLTAASAISTIVLAGIEVPINNGPVATGASGVLELNPSIDGTSINYNVDIKGVGSAVEKVHIHLGPSTAQGPLMFALHDIANDGPFVNPKQGTISLVDLKLDPVALTLETLGIADMSTVINNLQRGNAYVNIHTTIYPSGELRGQMEIAEIID